MKIPWIGCQPFKLTLIYHGDYSWIDKCAIRASWKINNWLSNHAARWFFIRHQLGSISVYLSKTKKGGEAISGAQINSQRINKCFCKRIRQRGCSFLMPKCHNGPCTLGIEFPLNSQRGWLMISCLLSFACNYNLSILTE